jgi:Domain of unknown function (DUF6532)
MWFSNKKDDGIKYPEIYKPFPKVALALILTAVCFPYLLVFDTNGPFQVENCIDEWADGTHTNISFTQDGYQDIFDEHLEELNRFDAFTKDLKIVPSLLWDLHDEGR